VHYICSLALPPHENLKKLRRRASIFNEEREKGGGVEEKAERGQRSIQKKRKK
jgi:hypothetical protein